jgi:hypothetical protein
MQNSTFIYALIDPITREIRYVGKANNPYNRLNKRHGHLSCERTCHKTYWIRSLLKQNLKPTYCILEQCSSKKKIWSERERDWIAFGKKIGWPLTNETNGGEGGGMLGRHLSEEHKRKLRRANKGRRFGPLSESAKQNISKSLIGNTRTKGMHHSEKTKQLMRKPHKQYKKREATSFPFCPSETSPLTPRLWLQVLSLQSC